MREKAGWIIGILFFVLVGGFGVLLAFGLLHGVVQSVDYLLWSGKIDRFLIGVVSFVFGWPAILLPMMGKRSWFSIISAFITVSCFLEIVFLALFHDDEMSIWLFLAMPFILYGALLLYHAINKTN